MERNTDELSSEKVATTAEKSYIMIGLTLACRKTQRKLLSVFYDRYSLKGGWGGETILKIYLENCGVLSSFLRSVSRGWKVGNSTSGILEVVVMWAIGFSGRS